MAQKTLSNILVKPAGADCNMRCEYCFYLHKCALYPETKVHRMSDEILAATIEQLMVFGGQNPTFGWQGGEPTLMGLDFFTRVVEYQRRFGYDGQVVGNGLQTNGILINEQWAGFLRENHFLVGLSLDGPQHVHDRYRCDAGGRHTTWERVVRAARLMMERNTPVNALVVINDYSVQYPEEVYDFLRSEKFDFLQFIPIVEPSADGRAAAPFTPSGPALGGFFCRVFDRWTRDFRDGFPTVSIRWFDSLLFTYVGLEAPECPMRDECGVYLCIEHTGDVYPCDFFVEPEWKLGHVLTDRFDHILNGGKMERFRKWKAQLPPECAGCQWYPHCFGGCTKDRVRDLSDRGSNHFCEGYKMFLEHADATFKRLAQRYRHEQMRQAARDARAATAPPEPAYSRYPESQPAMFASQEAMLASQEAMLAPQKAMLAPQEAMLASQKAIGRNEPCPCGSGKKYKRCCGR